MKRWPDLALGRLHGTVFLTCYSLVDLISSVLAAVLRRVLGPDT
jgi:hypothetical protein